MTTDTRRLLVAYRDSIMAQTFTGCSGAGDAPAYARALGYLYVEPLNLCSTAGDWQYLVSTDGSHWQLLCQENNYPRPGFTRHISDQAGYLGPLEEALDAFSQ